MKFVVKVSHNNNTVLTQGYKTKASAKKRFEKALKSYSGDGWTVELIENNNQSLFELTH